VVIFSEGLCKIVEQYLKKGSKVYIEGQPQTRKYNDRTASRNTDRTGWTSTDATMLDTREARGGGVRFRRQLRLAGRDPGAQARDGGAAASAATWMTRLPSSGTRRSGWIMSLAPLLQASPSFRSTPSRRWHSRWASSIGGRRGYPHWIRLSGSLMLVVACPPSSFTKSGLWDPESIHLLASSPW
jgi:single-stranded DNA-binding protein